jgi:transmembrane sensor
VSDLLKFRALADVEEEAAAWVWRLDDEDIEPKLHTEFEQWLRRDPRHRRAFEDLGGVWQSLDTLAEAKRDEKVATFVAEERRLQAAPQVKRRRRPARWLGRGVAASLLIAIGVLSWYHQEHESRTLSTAVGQHRNVTLADGSVVDLNTNSIVETRFTRTERSIYLRKGEALFTVAKNPDRPFVVIAGHTRVRAIGTAFNVRMYDQGRVEVIVTQGRVEVLQGGAPVFADSDVAAPARVPLPRSELTSGQRFQLGATSPVDTLSDATVDSALAWREGAIVFDGVPLAKAIEELNRYTDARLVIVDPEIQGMRVGGRFRTDDVDGFVAALNRAFPITTQRGADNLIYVRARETAPRLRQ